MIFWSNIQFAARARLRDPGDLSELSSFIFLLLYHFWNALDILRRLRALESFGVFDSIVLSEPFFFFKHSHTNGIFLSFLLWIYWWLFEQYWTIMMINQQKSQDIIMINAPRAMRGFEITVGLSDVLCIYYTEITLNMWISTK